MDGWMDGWRGGGESFQSKEGVLLLLRLIKDDI